MGIILQKHMDSLANFQNISLDINQNCYHPEHIQTLESFPPFAGHVLYSNF